MVPPPHRSDGSGGAFPIAVLNLKGGVGKTAVVEALGSTFAEARDDRIIAVDIDAGDLVDRHGRRGPLSMADLVSDNAVTRHMDVRAHTYMNSCGLEVLGLPEYAHTNSIDAIRKTRTTLEWLSNKGYRKLIGSTVLAINHVQPTKLETVAGKELEQLSAHVAATVVLPFDRHLHEGKGIGLDKLSKDSRRGHLELAAALADMFPSRARQPEMAHDPDRGVGVRSPSR